MTDLTKKTTALDAQSAVENSEEITQTPRFGKKSLFRAYGKTTLLLCSYWGYVRFWLFQVRQQMP